jgi:DNA-binding MarR family transcriptional regulator
MSKSAELKRKSSNHLRSSLRDTDTSDQHLAVSVWLRLMKCHNLIFRELRKSVEKHDQITLPQFDVLVQLSRQKEGLSFIDLSRRLLVTSGNLTGIVDRLEREGLVQREPDAVDRRIVRIHLTPKGRGMIKHVIPEHVKMIESLFAGISAEDLLRMREVLGTLKSVLGKRFG